MQEPQTPAAPSAPPSQAATPGAASTPGAPVVAGGGTPVAGAKPAELYMAVQAQRRVLLDQLERLEDQRRVLVSSLEERPMDAVARQGIEQRLVVVDQRIVEVTQQLAASEREVARVAGIPGAAVEPPRQREQDGDAEAVAIIGTTFTLLVLFPLALAHARRVWRRGAHSVAALPGELMERFTRLEQTVDSVAIEVERISEGQRFVTRLMSEGRGTGASSLGAGAAQPLEARVPQAEPAYRARRDQ